MPSTQLCVFTRSTGERAIVRTPSPMFSLRKVSDPEFRQCQNPELLHVVSLPMLGQLGCFSFEPQGHECTQLRTAVYLTSIATHATFEKCSFRAFSVYVMHLTHSFYLFKKPICHALTDDHCRLSSTLPWSCSSSVLPLTCYLS